jgi:hypothetical protein
LYQAKRDGRNRVCVVTEDATLGASGHGVAQNGATGGQDAPEMPGPVTKAIQA